ncbi:MAG: hypothetical protein IJW71_06255 [Clostridia bacterium]|nr:hypothetical protein [Clostridia bacterium]
MRKISLLLAMPFCLLPLAACEDTNAYVPPTQLTAVAASFPDGHLGLGEPHPLKVTGADTGALTHCHVKSYRATIETYGGVPDIFAVRVR